MLLALPLAGCLTAPPVETTGSESDTDSETTTTTGPGPTTSTNTTTTPTTVTPTTETTTDSESESETTTEDPIVCGNGEIEAGEECDDGPDNSDGASCTSDCKLNICGDGLILEGGEACDDGTSNGEYGACASDCSGPGPYCGDGMVDADNEQCDGGGAEDGCVASTCQLAVSCLELLEEYDDLVSGPFTIYPKDKDTPTEVYCDMTGGWTYLKYRTAPDNLAASEAEASCMEHGLHLFYPSTEMHLISALGVAMSDTLIPVGGDMPDPNPNYLRIMALYPSEAGQSCVDFPFNSEDCPEWESADGGSWWVTSQPVSGQPGTSNCAGCSLYYTADPEMMAVTSYEAFTNGGKGAESGYFLCSAY